ncbi:MAG: copper resistance CopC family protein [Actinomycetota bacterium]
MTTRTGSALLAALAILLAVAAPPAAAHTSLRSTSPSEGDRLTAPPAEVTLVFTDQVLEIGTAVAVTGPAGPVDAGPPVVDGASVTAGLPAGLPGGDYEVAWRVTAADGHPISGTFAFSVAAAATTSETAAAPATTPPNVAAAPADGGVPASRWWLLAVAVLLGAAVAFAVRRRRSPSWPR